MMMKVHIKNHLNMLGNTKSNKKYKKTAIIKTKDHI